MSIHIIIILYYEILDASFYIVLFTLIGYNKPSTITLGKRKLTLIRPLLMRC